MLHTNVNVLHLQAFRKYKHQKADELDGELGLKDFRDFYTRDMKIVVSVPVTECLTTLAALLKTIARFHFAMYFVEGNRDLRRGAHLLDGSQALHEPDALHRVHGELSR